MVLLWFFFPFYDHLTLPFSLIAISKLLSNLQSFPHYSSLSADNFHLTEIRSHQTGTAQFPAMWLLVFPHGHPPTTVTRGELSSPFFIQILSLCYFSKFTLWRVLSQKSLPLKQQPYPLTHIPPQQLISLLLLTEFLNLLLSLCLCFLTSHSFFH